MLKILVADDHPIVRQGIKQIIADTTDMVVAGEASSGQEVLNAVKDKTYDVILLDIAMPGPNSIDILKQLKQDKPQIAVLILSIYPEEQYAVRTLKAGASGYLTKESAPDELVEAIRKVSKGGKYITSSLAESLAKILIKEEQGLPHTILSDREYQVLLMISSGKKIKEIANELSLSIKTISTYRTRMLEKMNMKTNAELIHYSIKHELVD
jgi:DNA-binding NarL/FixJ family response regulator